MTTFVYKAKKDSAQTVKGQVNAKTEDEAIELINQLGLLPITVEARISENDAVDLGKPKRVKPKDQYIFSRQLSNLLKSGVSLMRALSILQEQTQDPYFKKVIGYLVIEIKDGNTFSDSLGHFPHIFSSLYITMVNAGEESGNLRDMLEKVANYQKSQAEITNKVKTALTYPILMASVGAVTVYFILTFALPKMAGLFQNIGDELPLPTVILLNISNILNKGWLWILTGVCAFGLFAYRWVRSEKGQTQISQVILRLPLFGQLILKVELARFCRTLDLLLKSGVTIIRALEISIPIVKNQMVGESFLLCKEKLETGGSFGEGLKESKVIPSMLGHLIAVGEESGNLNEVLVEAADNYEQESNEQIKVMTTLLEPIMILIVGVVVGFIVFAMLLPIFQIDILAS